MKTSENYPFVLYSPPEVAEMIDLAPEYVTRLCASGDIDARKVGRGWVVSEPALEAYKAKPKNGRGKYPRKPKEKSAENNP